ncbi:probable 2-oxoglutarate-dependent dioxygenase AOP1.2 [Lycium barbarum]|uniref:probable 2-oxoglutarate-dependent dioxygenase AOP1.2 n=1 Tax=Lycium barbarum TaxID=112863 RepID=UPI00293F5F5B|nr:probable 2-oxoglutarate-dependent dioxygenase AOP1.2 [Lycium barbarum]
MTSKEVKIPTTDFCKVELKPDTTHWHSTKAQVFQALQEYGCFEAIYDNVPSEIRESMFGTLKEIFEFPLETKLKNLSDKPLQGYLGQIPHLLLYESVSVSDLLQSQSVEMFANIFWPHDGKPDCCNVVKSYSKSPVELDKIVKRMVLETLGLKHYVKDEFLEPNEFEI